MIDFQICQKCPGCLPGTQPTQPILLDFQVQIRHNHVVHVSFNAISEVHVGLPYALDDFATVVLQRATIGVG